MSNNSPDTFTKIIIGFLFLFLTAGFFLLIYLLIYFWPDNPEKAGEFEVMRLVVAAGGLGSFVHIATSFTDYVGNRLISCMKPGILYHDLLEIAFIP